MKRRQFVGTAVGLTLFPTRLFGKDTEPSLKITRVVSFEVPTRRPKLVGKNSRLGVHGETSRDRMVRMYTDGGIDGVGNCRARKEALAQLLGRNPLEFFDDKRRRMAGVLGAGTMPLWDLVGKIHKQPVWRLLGGKGPKRVGAYDGSIYFADLLPQYEARWRQRFKEETDMGLKRGHRAFKIKIGRGNKWMERSAGDRRDIEIVKLIRKHAGDDILIGVDANNGYDLAGAQRFLKEVGDQNIAFAEEMFPETVENCLRFKRFIADQGLKTLLADGETQGDLNVFKPFIEAKAIDILQADMNRFGIEGIMTEADWARPQGIRVAPHNWGSLFGFHLQLHAGRAITNFYRAENDPLATDIVLAPDYRIENGTVEVPDLPGFGLFVDEKKFANAKVHFDLKL